MGYVIPEDDPVIADMFRAYAREKPIPRKHIVDWDVCLVLNFFKSERSSNWGQLSDKDLTLKTACSSDGQTKGQITGSYAGGDLDSRRT